MQSILKELWHGNIETNATGKPMSKRTHSIMKDLSAQYDNLKNSLSKQQLLLLQEYDQTYCNLLAISEEEIFIYGFQLGVKLTFECMALEMPKE